MGTVSRSSGGARRSVAPTLAAPPWLWLYGPPGVGKSSTGFEVFSRLRSQSRRVGFIELDQIGMCMPAPTEVRSKAKIHNLLAMLDNFALAGAEGVVVTGDIVGAPMDEVLRLARTPPTLCRLRADHDVIVERLAVRRSLQYAEASRIYDTAQTVPPGDMDLVTHPRGVGELAGELLGRLGPWPPHGPAQTGTSRGQAPVHLPRSAVLVTGPRAVGKSRVAWELHMGAGARGVRCGFLDLTQMRFLASSGPETVELGLANVAACWEGFRRQGAERLVLCGAVEAPADMHRYRQLFPSLHVVALTASYEVLLNRARCRAGRREIWLAGDDLYGRAEADLSRVVTLSMDPSDEGADVVVPTDGLSVEEVAARVLVW